MKKKTHTQCFEEGFALGVKHAQSNPDATYDEIMSDFNAIGKTIKAMSTDELKTYLKQNEHRSQN